MKPDRKKETAFSVVLTVLLLAFLGLVFYVNLSCNPEYYDGDIYNDIRFAKEAWNAKSLFPSDWVFGNQVYVVATPVLAALFFGLIGDGFTAMAIASCIMSVLVVITYDWMTRTLFSYNERTAGFLFMVGVLLLKGHVAESQQGIQMFFTMASYYSCYLINAFIVYGCYIRIRQKNFTGKNIVPAVIGAVLSFGTGMQSLRQTAVMALPLIACEIMLTVIYSVKNKKIAFFASTFFSVIVFVTNIAGYIAMKFIKINQSSIYGTTTLVKSFKDFFEKFLLNLEYVGLAFGLDALKLRVRLAVSVIFLLIILLGFVLCVIDFFKGRTREPERFTLVILLFFGSASVFAAGVLTDIVNRAIYYFMLYPLLAVCVSYIIIKFEKKRNVVFSIIAVFMAGMITFRATGAVGEIKAGKDENSTAHRIADYMLDNGYETVFCTFGLSGLVDGAENVVVASGDRIRLVQYKRTDVRLAMKPVEFLCIKDNYKRWNNDKSLYLLRDYELPKVRELADKYGVEMTEKAQFDGGIHLYGMSENLCVYTAEQE